MNQKIHFYKYQATGNDFVIVDNRLGQHEAAYAYISSLCDRKKGIGADGFLCLENSNHHDFSLKYFNANGTTSLCANGCRAAVHLAHHLQIIEGNQCIFDAFDGPHHATLHADGSIKLQMNDVTNVTCTAEDFVVDTGSPHYVRFCNNIDTIDVVKEGRSIRQLATFQPDGINVNFAELKPLNTIALNTYERGVENETLSCGTGAVAVALCASLKGNHLSPITVHNKGGVVTITFDVSKPRTFTNISITGLVVQVFEGEIVL